MSRPVLNVATRMIDIAYEWENFQYLFVVETSNVYLIKFAFYAGAIAVLLEYTRRQARLSKEDIEDVLEKKWPLFREHHCDAMSSGECRNAFYAGAIAASGKIQAC